MFTATFASAEHNSANAPRLFSIMIESSLAIAMTHPPQGRSCPAFSFISARRAPTLGESTRNRKMAQRHSGHRVGGPPVYEKRLSQRLFHSQNLHAQAGSVRKNVERSCDKGRKKD
jgi:hypothetical protein